MLDNLLRFVGDLFTLGDKGLSKNDLLLDSVFQLMARVVTADGTISNEELNCVRLFASDAFKLDEKSQKRALRAFDKGLQTDYEIGPLLETLRSELGEQKLVEELILDVLVQLSMADGDYASEEEEVIKQVASGFNISAQRIEELRYHYSDSDSRFSEGSSKGLEGYNSGLSLSGSTCLKMLGLKGTATRDDVLRTWEGLNSLYKDSLSKDNFPKLFAYYAANRRERMEQAHKIVLSELS